MNTLVSTLYLPEIETPTITRIRPGNGVVEVDEFEYIIDRYGSKLAKPRYSDLMK